MELNIVHQRNLVDSAITYLSPGVIQNLGADRKPFQSIEKNKEWIRVKGKQQIFVRIQILHGVSNHYVFSQLFMNFSN